ncbi:MAG: hypothetical protein ABIR54_17290 [Burkholderiaceae bacterium]
MHLLTKSLFVLALLAGTGCTKADDARREHLLAGSHGWIDITLKAPPAAKAAASAAGGSAVCAMRLQINGETRLDETGDLVQADAADNSLGYRFVVPAGKLNTELTIRQCVKDELRLPLPLMLNENQLALLEFDGQRLVLGSTQAYEPTTLAAVRGDVAKLHQHSEATDGTLAMLTKLAIASLVLNVVVILVALRRRRS